jgi:hypothetical protein
MQAIACADFPYVGDCLSRSCFDRAMHLAGVAPIDALRQ